MDPSLALVWRAPVLVDVQGTSAQVAPGWCPGWLPMRSISAATRAALAAPGPMPRAQRVAWALEAESPLAWTLSKWPRDLATDGVIALWAARRAAHQGWPAASHGAIILGGSEAVKTGLGDARRVLAVLGGQTWAGPLVVVADGRSLPDLSTDSVRCLRPALPMLRISASAAREQTATAVVTLFLDLQGPSQPWWREGLTRLATTRPDPGPRTQGERRAAAGRAGIDRLLREGGEPELAAAVVAWCVDRRRSARLPDLQRLMAAGLTGTRLLEQVYVELQGFD